MPQADLVGRLPLEIRGIGLVGRALQEFSCKTCTELEGLGLFRAVLPTTEPGLYVGARHERRSESHCYVVILTCNRRGVVPLSRRGLIKCNCVAFTEGEV